jgi:hypothetical protein
MSYTHYLTKIKRNYRKQARGGGGTPVIPGTWEVKTRGLWSEASLGKVSVRPYLKTKTLKVKQVGAWLKW